MNIVSIDLNKRSVLVPLFADHPAERIFINSILEGCTGIALADSKTNPQVAQLTVNRWTSRGVAIKAPRYLSISVLMG